MQLYAVLSHQRAQAEVLSSMKALQMKSWEDPVGILMQINRVGAVVSPFDLRMFELRADAELRALKTSLKPVSIRLSASLMRRKLASRTAPTRALHDLCFSRRRRCPSSRST